MLLTLIKNELIKISKRGKTWVVFVLFLLLAVLGNVMAYISDKDMRYYMSPEGQIQSLNREIEWADSDIKYYESRIKEEKNENIINDYKVQIEYAKERKATINESIKVQQDLIGKEIPEDQWKKDLEEEKKFLKEEIDNEDIPDEQKVYQKRRIQEIESIENSGIKPVASWEFGPFNNTIGLFTMIGSIILVAGIAVFMSDIVSGESTPPTLKFLLVQPVSRGKVIASKFVAITLTVVAMIASIEILMFLIAGAMTGFSGAEMPKVIGLKFKEVFENGYNQVQPVANSGDLSTMLEYVLKSFGLQMLFVMACCSFVFLISTMFKSSMITMAVSVIISVSVTMVSMGVSTIGKYAHLIFLNYGATPQVVEGEVAYMFQNANFSPELGAILMMVVIVICPILSYFIFKKKDMLV